MSPLRIDSIGPELIWMQDPQSPHMHAIRWLARTLDMSADPKMSPNAASADNVPNRQTRSVDRRGSFSVAHAFVCWCALTELERERAR